MPDAHDTETLAEVLADLNAHARCYPAISGRGDEWCSGCDWTGPRHQTHLAEVLAARIVQARKDDSGEAVSPNLSGTAPLIPTDAGEGALREVRRAIGELLRTLDEGRYRFEETHVRADLNYLRALTRAAALDPEATT